MKNKLSKLFFFGSLLLTGAMIITACGKKEGGNNYGPDDPSNPGGDDPSNPGGDPTTPTDPEEKTNFPAEELQSFLKDHNSSTEVPSPVSTGEWTYQVVTDDGNPYFFATVADTGTIGVDSIEDTYLAALIADGWETDDSSYDADGYYALKDNVALEFFTWDGTFRFYAEVDPGESDKYEVSDSFPSGPLQVFLKLLDLSQSVPAPTSANKWYYTIDSESFYTYTEDNGTVGVDSIEDTYTSLLRSQGWVIDSTYYEFIGYYADKGGVELWYFTSEGKFVLYVYAGGDAEEYETSEDFPAVPLKAFLEEEGLETVVPSIGSDYQWSYAVQEDDDGSRYFVTFTQDDGTPGKDSIEDAYYSALVTASWTIDDSEYEDYGYFAFKGDVEIQFYSFDGYFNMWVYAGDGDLPTPTPTPEYDGEWVLVNDASSLKDGDVIVLGENSKNVVSGKFDTKYLTPVEAEFSSDGKTISALPSKASPLTLNKSGDSWNLVMEDGELIGAKAKKELVLDQGTTTWNISIDSDGNATIASTNSSYGRILYNAQSTGLRFMNYTSDLSDDMLLPEIYRLQDAEPVYPTSITLSGKETVGINQKATLTVNYEPSNTNQKEVTWTSSNTNIATVKDGVVTGVALGNAVITATAVGENNSEVKAQFTITVVEPQNDSWTLMFYVCGSDLESDEDEKTGRLSALATSDLEEILSVDNQPDDVNIIVETGGASEWSSKYGIKANELGRYYVEDGKLVKEDALTEASMGEQSTFESFLTWGIESYPAERYGVFMWNHGGAMDGCCFDENFENDSLTNAEINGALTNVEKALGLTDKLEFIAYDACLMAVQDVAEMNSHHFNYMLSSQESESGYGYDYDAWLPTLYANPSTVTTEALLTKVGQTFLEEEEELFEAWEEPFDQTQSVYDLSKMEEYKNAFEAVASGLSGLVNSSSWTSFVNNNIKANNVQQYGIYDGEYLYDIYDAEDVLDNIAKNYSSLSSLVATAKAALGELVVWESHGDATSGCGLNIYCPTVSEYNRYYSSDTNFTNWYNLCKLSGLCIDE